MLFIICLTVLWFWNMSLFQSLNYYCILILGLKLVLSLHCTCICYWACFPWLNGHRFADGIRCSHLSTGTLDSYVGYESKYDHSDNSNGSGDIDFCECYLPPVHFFCTSHVTSSTLDFLFDDWFLSLFFCTFLKILLYFYFYHGNLLIPLTAHIFINYD